MSARGAAAGLVGLVGVACSGGAVQTGVAGSGGHGGRAGSDGQAGGGAAGGGATAGGGAGGRGGDPAGSGGSAGGTGGLGGLGGSRAGGGVGGSGAMGGLGGAGGGLGPFSGIDFGAISDGGTITFQNIGAVGSYPSVCAPPSGGGCCRQPLAITSDALTPWDEELIMTLRGPMVVKQLAVYQPAGPSSAGSGSPWQLAAGWDARTPAGGSGLAFTGNAAPNATFAGTVGSVCLVNASTDQAFVCGPGSSPYCAANSSNHDRGWAGSKLFVLLASMPHVGAGDVTTAESCAASTNGWTDAPWIGFSVGELIRSGAFSSCQCYETTPNHGDGCGQFNALEVINDNDTTGNYKNLELFSSNFFGYGGDFGGPCGTNACNLSGLGSAADLVAGSAEATQGALASQTPRKSPAAFFRRPTGGYRYFLILLDVDTRTVQMAVVHPQNLPAALAPLLPNLPPQVPRAAIDALIGLRLPH